MSARAVLRRGDVVIATFPFTDLSSSKRRPAVVLTINTNTNDVILAFISSVVPTRLAPFDIALSPSDAEFAQSGLKVPSVIRLNKLATVEQRLLTRRIGSLTTNLVHLLDQKLVHALGIAIGPFLDQEHERLRNIFNTQGAEAVMLDLNRIR